MALSMMLTTPVTAPLVRAKRTFSAAPASAARVPFKSAKRAGAVSLTPRRGDACCVRAVDDRSSRGGVRRTTTTGTASQEDFQETLQKWVQNVDEAFPDKTRLWVLVGGAVFVLILANGIVSSTERLPLIPGFLRLVGLGYTGFFSYKYVLYREGRADLRKKLSELKGKITGSGDLDDFSDITKGTGESGGASFSASGATGSRPSAATGATSGGGSSSSKGPTSGGGSSGSKGSTSGGGSSSSKGSTSSGGSSSASGSPSQAGGGQEVLSSGPGPNDKLEKQVKETVDSALKEPPRKGVAWNK